VKFWKKLYLIFLIQVFRVKSLSLGVITLSPTLEVLTFFFLSTIDDILSTSCFPPGIFLEIAPANDKDFTQLKNGNWKNKHTGEIWSKDKSNHYGEGSCICQYSSSEILVLEK
jgi:hypothetical protein